MYISLHMDAYKHEHNKHTHHKQRQAILISNKNINSTGRNPLCFFLDSMSKGRNENKSVILIVVSFCYVSAN